MNTIDHITQLKQETQRINEALDDAHKRFELMLNEYGINPADLTESDYTNQFSTFLANDYLDDCEDYTDGDY